VLGEPHYELANPNLDAISHALAMLTGLRWRNPESFRRPSRQRPGSEMAHRKTWVSRSTFNDKSPLRSREQWRIEVVGHGELALLGPGTPCFVALDGDEPSHRLTRLGNDDLLA